MSGPLAGIRVLDLTHVWAGPLAARLLGDLGAEVVCIEPPFGRGPRQFPDTPLGGFLGGEPGDEPWNANALFVKLHRNRRSVCLDLKLATARDVFLDLVAEADVLIENFSAGTMAELGLGFEALRARNPRLIYASLPGFGSVGPYSEWVAFGLTVEAMSGLTEVMGYSPEETRNSTIALNDPMTATHAAAAIGEALLRRRRTGVGESIELTLHDAGVAFNGPWFAGKQLGETIEAIGNGHPSMAPHGVYRCEGADEWIALACADDSQWRALCSFIGDETLDQHWSIELRQTHQAEIDERMAVWCAKRSAGDAVLELQSIGVAAGMVQGARLMLADEQVNARGFFTFTEAFDTPMPGNPLRMQGVDPATWRRCPRLGEDNAAVLRDWLSVSDDTIEGLAANGALLDQPPG